MHVVFADDCWLALKFRDGLKLVPFLDGRVGLIGSLFDTVVPLGLFASLRFPYCLQYFGRNPFGRRGEKIGVGIFEDDLQFGE